VHAPELPGKFPLAEAAAFASAVETGEPVTALRNAGELSPALVPFFASESGETFHLYPIVAGGKVSAILYADSENAD
ncbi:hypothetical protein, partial [Escherichia coli]|uniref:hypothetical protein n=1 Tax=Escherichia coli TaxID=562 RepID=UPI0039E0B60C